MTLPMKPNGTARIRVTNRFSNILISEKDEPCRITPKRIAISDNTFDRATLLSISPYKKGTYNYQLLSFEANP